MSTSKNHWSLAMVYFLIGTLTISHGKKLQSNSLVHSLLQHHMVIMSSMLLCVLTPSLILLSSQETLTNQAITLLIGLSIPGSPGTQNQSKSSITLEENTLVLLSNNQQLLQLMNMKSILATNKNPQLNVICKWMNQTISTLLKTLSFKISLNNFSLVCF